MTETEATLFELVASSSVLGAKVRSHCLGGGNHDDACVHRSITSTPSVTPLVPWLSPLVSQTLSPSMHTFTFFSTFLCLPRVYLFIVLLFMWIKPSLTSFFVLQWRRFSPFHHYNYFRVWNDNGGGTEIFLIQVRIIIFKTGQTIIYSCFLRVCSKQGFIIFSKNLLVQPAVRPGLKSA